MPAAIDGFEYADVAALEAVWPETDTMAAVSTWSIEASVVHGGAASAQLVVSGTTGAGESCYRERTFTGLRPNAHHRVRVYVWLNEEVLGSTGIAFGVEVVGGGAGYIEVDGSVNAWVLCTAEGTTDGAGNLTVRIGAFDSLASTYDRVARFDDLTIEEFAEWPRDILPQRVTDFEVPGALASTSQTGRQERRSTLQVGRRWSETYPPFKANTADGRRFLAFIRKAWRNGDAFDIDHQYHLVNLGGGGGSPLVAGASQTGATLATDGWTGTDPVLRAGDLIRVSGIGHLLEITADADDLVGGAVTLDIAPPLFDGGSPADNAAILVENIRLIAVLAEPPVVPDGGADYFIGGLTLTFEEVVT